MINNNDKVEKKFYDEIIATKQRIEVLPGKCRYNYKCHMNAVHEALKHGHKSVAMVVYLHDKKVDPIIHFVNFHKGKYKDNTLGQWAKNHEYYLIKLIGAEDFDNIEYIFNAYRRTIRSNWNWWLRLTSDKEF